MKYLNALFIGLLLCTTSAQAQIKPDVSDNPMGFGSSHIDSTLGPSQSFLRTPTGFGGGVMNFQSGSVPWELRPFGLTNNSINDSVASPESYVTSPMNFRSLGMNMTANPMQSEALHPTGYGGYGMARSISESGVGGPAGMSAGNMIDRLNSSFSSSTGLGSQMSNPGLGLGSGAGFGGGFGAGSGANMYGTSGFGSSFGQSGF